MKDFKLVEHNLIPLSLFALNISVVHLLYLLFIDNILSFTTLLVFSSTIVLVAGVIRKEKVLMIPGALVYTIVLLFSL
ncbi:MAG: hypothetical protein ACO1NS_10050 [Daejeonella sp.]